MLVGRWRKSWNYMLLRIGARSVLSSHGYKRWDAAATDW